MDHGSSEALTIFENAQYISDAVFDMVAGIAHIIEKPSLYKPFLFLSQPFYILGEIRNDEIEESRCPGSDETLCAGDWSHNDELRR